MVARCSLPVVAALVLLTGSAVWANTITPGQSGVAPDIFPGSEFTIITASGVLDYSFDGGLTTGQYEEYVATDTANPYCSNCLDFGFIFSVTDPNNFITGIELADFGGFATDGGYSQSGDQVAPGSMFRSSTGESVGFTFTGVIPGEDSAVLVVKTNATSFGDDGLATLVVDTGEFLDIPDYGPTAAPEPSSAVLLGLGILALASFRKKLFRLP